MDLDTLVSAGQPLWEPSPDAEDMAVWDRPDCPLFGTYRLGDRLIMFTLILAVGKLSVWAYVPVPVEREAATRARFKSDAELSDFVSGCFSAQEVSFALADDAFIILKSDGVPVGTGPDALMAAAEAWADLLDIAADMATATNAGQLRRAVRRALALTQA